MEKKIKIAAVGDNCIDLYVNTGEFYRRKSRKCSGIR